MARNVHARTVSLPIDLEADIERIAAENGLSFSAAVTQMCRRSIHMDFDKNFVPHISQVVGDGNDDVVRRVAGVVNVGLEDAVEYVLEEMRQMFKEAADGQRDEEL